MNVLMLCAGSSAKFQDSGSPYPKNLVEIGGRPLIQHVIDSWRPMIGQETKVIVAIRGEENRIHHTGAVIRLLFPTATICECPEGVAGAACTALLAVGHIDSEEPLLIVNGDQILAPEVICAVRSFPMREWDGGMVVFRDVHPRWSFVRVDDDQWVTEAAEKRPISNLATAGVYFFRHGSSFVRAAKRMILKSASVDGVYYVCPSYNELILEGARIGVHEIPKAMYSSLSTPANVSSYGDRLSMKT